MVRLSKIYTKTGDAGTTGLGDGKRVRKDDLRVEAYGTVDEANSFVGAAANIAGSAPPGTLAARIGDLLRGIQNDLFDVGADLCCPIIKGEKPGSKLRISAQQTKRLEDAIDQFNEDLQPLNSFVLPGGSNLASTLHIARAVTRRAERCCVSLFSEEPEATSDQTIIYLNRLSDLLFVLARVANDNGRGDILWRPGLSQTAKPDGDTKPKDAAGHKGK